MQIVFSKKAIVEQIEAFLNFALPKMQYVI